MAACEDDEEDDILSRIFDTSKLFNEAEDKEADLVRESTFSAEEIEKFTIDEDLHELDKALLFIEKGYPVQRHSAVTSLPRLFLEYGQTAFDKLFGALAENVNSMKTETRTAAASCFSKIITEKLLGTDQIAGSVFPLILEMLDSQNEEVAKAWIEPCRNLLSNVP
eukprot:110143_1